MKAFLKSALLILSILVFLNLVNSCKSKTTTITIDTAEVSGITQTLAESGGKVAAGKNILITGKGVCWGMAPDPTITDNKTDEGSGSGEFISKLTGLGPGTEYYVRAYATSNKDTVYGRNVSFTTEVYPTITDIEGNVYNVITIGKQTWMTENLRTAKYNDGTPVQQVKDESAWAGLSNPGFTWYKNEEESFKQVYGALYNWYAVNTGKLCPAGWHVPSDDDWNELASFSGGEQIAGGKLKETGTTYWVDPNYGATNEYGFSAFPGGFRYFDGKFFDFGFSGYWWTSTEYSGTRAYFRFLYYNESTLYRFNNDKRNGFSVRCMKDQ